MQMSYAQRLEDWLRRAELDALVAEIVSDGGAQIATPRSIEAGNAIDFRELERMGARHGRKFLKAMQCLNIPQPLGQGLWEGVPLRILLKTVGRMNNIEVGNDELSRAIMAEARRYPGRERQVIEFYNNTPQALAQVRAPLYEDKVVDYILELADVSERTVTPEEMLAAVSEAGMTGKAEPAAEAPAAS